MPASRPAAAGRAPPPPPTRRRDGPRPRRTCRARRRPPASTQRALGVEVDAQAQRPGPEHALRPRAGRRAGSSRACSTGAGPVQFTTRSYDAVSTLPVRTVSRPAGEQVVDHRRHRAEPSGAGHLPVPADVPDELLALLEGQPGPQVVGDRLDRLHQAAPVVPLVDDSAAPRRATRPQRPLVAVERRRRAGRLRHVPQRQQAVPRGRGEPDARARSEAICTATSTVVSPVPTSSTRSSSPTRSSRPGAHGSATTAGRSTSRPRGRRGGGLPSASTTTSAVSARAGGERDE